MYRIGIASFTMNANCDIILFDNDGNKWLLTLDNSDDRLRFLDEQNVSNGYIVSSDAYSRRDFIVTVLHNPGHWRWVFDFEFVTMDELTDKQACIYMCFDNFDEYWEVKFDVSKVDEY